MPLTKENRLSGNLSNNNDHNYLHKKFKKVASTVSLFSQSSGKAEEIRNKDANVEQTASSTLITNGSISASHPEIEKIKGVSNIRDVGNVQTNFNYENSRLNDVNNVVQTGQTSFSDEFSNKTDNLENDFIRDANSGGTGGRYVCPYCKLPCAKPSVLQKHIRAHTNERPFPCEPCGFAFKTKSNLYKHRRSRTHALRLQGADISGAVNDEELSGGSESDTSIPPTPASDASSDITRLDNRPNEFSSPELITDSASVNSLDSSKSKSLYKPKFRAALYQDSDRDKQRKTISSNADFLTEHISKIISANEAIVDVIDTPLQKKYGKIKQIAESKQFLNESNELKTESPLNLTKNLLEIDNSFRKRSHSESFSQYDQKHPLNPEGSIIKDLLLKTKINGLASVTAELTDGLGPLFVCPMCQKVYRSAQNLEVHRMEYCKGSSTSNGTNSQLIQKETKMGRADHLFVRSNSVNVRLPETQTNASKSHNSPLRNKPDNLVIIKPETGDVVAPLPSPGPLLGNTRLVDTRTPEYAKRSDLRGKSLSSPKRRLDSIDVYSPRLIENISPYSAESFPSQPKIKCLDVNSVSLRSLDELPHFRHNSTSLQMFGGEVKIMDHLGSTTTLRIEPSKNQLSPILIQQNLSPSKVVDVETSNVVVRSGLHSGGTMVHNPPTPKDMIVGTSQPHTPRIGISSSGMHNSNIPILRDISHFQFPPLSVITAFNPLTLPPLSPTSTPNGATTILHGGKLIPHVPGMPGPNSANVYMTNHNVNVLNNTEVLKSSPVHSVTEGAHDMISTAPVVPKGTIGLKYEPIIRNVNLKIPHSLEKEKYNQNYDNYNTEKPQQYLPVVPIIKVKNVDEPPKTAASNLVKPVTAARQDLILKRNSEGIPKLPILKEINYLMSNKNKIRDRHLINSSTTKKQESKPELEVRNFNFENMITKTEIFNNQIASASEVSRADQETLVLSTERSETLYFQKNSGNKSDNEDKKPKFLRPSTLPLKPGTFTPKRHHGITPNANTMPLVSPETPRPAKAYGQLYLNGNAYTYLGLKCSTKVFYCTINRPQPTYVPNQHFLSMYSNWQLLSELTPDPLGLSASSAMSLYDSRHRPQNVSAAVIKQDLILTHSSQWNISPKDSKQILSLAEAAAKIEESNIQNTDAVTPKKELAGGFESNEEYTYVRGRGRGRYVCSECGIRCKKPSMLKKHIRTHTDVRPYTCVHCAFRFQTSFADETKTAESVKVSNELSKHFSFKTKGNLTKHMKSKAHYKKCCELGLNPNEGNELDAGEMAQGSGETDDETESDGEEGNEGETESSDTEVCKSRLPEHEAAHCLLSLGGSRPATSATPGLITSARPSTYPYTPTGLENINMEFNIDRMNVPSKSPTESRMDVDNEPMDLSKTEARVITPNIPEIATARESSVLASLASNTAKLPQHQTQWSNGEPMLHTYLTEKALQDSKIKQSQLTSNSKLKRTDSIYTEANSKIDPVKALMKNSAVSTVTSQVFVNTNVVKINEGDNGLLPIAKQESTKVEPPLPIKQIVEPVRNHPSNNSNAENVKQVVSEYLKQARTNVVRSVDDNSQNQREMSGDENSGSNIDDKTSVDDAHDTESDSTKLPMTEHDPVARKVVIGVGGVAFKVTKGKDFDGASYPPGRLMEDGRRVCDFCNKTFTKPSQLKLHLNIHYMERPFRCSVCAVSFRTRGHLQKHERSGSHHNKVSMTSTFGAATSFNPRPFRCSDCNIAFRIHGHLAKHLRSKMHVMRLECLFKLPFGTFTEIERAGVSLTDIDTTDCASSLASLQTLARKLHEKDPTKLEYREPNGSLPPAPPVARESSEDEDMPLPTDNACESEKECGIKTIENSDPHDEP